MAMMARIMATSQKINPKREPKKLNIIELLDLD